jgi:hypothetical protein
MGQPRHPGYQGVLTVTGHDDGSTVTVRVRVPDLPPAAGEELARGTAEALERIGRLART